MIDSCTWHPCKVNRETGKITDKISQFYKSLLKLIDKVANYDRARVNKLFALSQDSRFMAKYDKDIIFTSQEADREPVLASFYEIARSQMQDVKLSDIRDIVAEEFEEGYYDFEEAQQRMQNFNEQMKGAHSLMATIEYQDNGKYLFKIDYNTRENQDKLVKTLTTKLHADAIIQKLRQFGVGVATEGNLSKFDTINPKILSDGLMGIISLGENKKTLSDLAKETGHFIAEALGREHPFIQKMVKAIDTNPKIVEQLLGEDEYDFYNRSENRVEEFVGHLIGKYLQEYDINLSKKPLKYFGQLIKRAAEYIKSRLSITNRGYKKSLYNAKYNAIKAVKSFMGDNFDGSIEQALSESKVLYSIDNSLEGTVKQILRELRLAEKNVENISKEVHKDFSDTRKLLFEKYGEAKGIDPTIPDLFRTDEQNLKFYEVIISAMSFATTQFVTSAREIQEMLNKKSTDDFSIKRCAEIIKLAQQNMAFVDFLINRSENIINSFKSGSLQQNLLRQAFKELGVIRNKSLKRNENEISMYNAINQSRFNLGMRIFCELNGDRFISRDQFIHVRWMRLKAFNIPIPRLMRESERLMKIDDLVKEQEPLVNRNFGKLSRMIYSMADNPSITNQMIYDLIEEKKHESNIKTLQMRDRILDLYNRVPKKGNMIRKDTRRFMETFANGTLTGNVLSNVHWGNWEEAMKKELKDFRKDTFEKYKSIHGWETVSDMCNDASFIAMYNRKKAEWHAKNSISTEDELTGMRTYRPNPAKYRNYEYDRLSDEEREWLEEYKQLKKELDDLLPAMATAPDGIRAPQFLGTYTEAIRNGFVNGSMTKSESWKNGLVTTVARGFSYNFRINPEDIEWGGENNTYDLDEWDEFGVLRNVDFQDRLANMDTIPMYGVKKLPNLNQLSTDICGSLIAYANMVYNFNSLDEVAEGIIQYAQYQKSNQYQDSQRTWFSVDSPLEYERLEDYIQQQIFGKYYRRTGGIPVSVTKSIKLTTRLATYWHLGSNWASANVNTMTAFYQMLRQSIKGDTFNFPDFFMANVYFIRYAVDTFIRQFFNPNGSLLEANNVMELLARRWDTTDNNFRRFRDVHLNTPGYDFMQGYSLINIAMLPYSLSEKWMQSIAYFATARHTKVRAQILDEKGDITYKYSNLLKIFGQKDGKLYVKDGYGKLMTDRSVEDGFKKWQIYDEDLERKLRIAKRIVNEGVRNKQGTDEEYGWSNEDIGELKEITGAQYVDYHVKEDNRYEEAWVELNTHQENLYRIKCRGIDNRMHGVYNTGDGGAYLGSMFGPMFASMKKYAIGMWDERFSKSRYDYRQKKMREGNFESIVKFALDMTVESVCTAFASQSEYYDKITNHGKSKSLVLGNDTITARVMNALTRSIQLILAGSILCYTNWSKNYLRSWGYGDVQIYNVRAFWADMIILYLTNVILSFAAPPSESDEPTWPEWMEGWTQNQTAKRLAAATIGNLPFVNHHEWGRRRHAANGAIREAEQSGLQKFLAKNYFALRRNLPFQKTKNDQEILSDFHQTEEVFQKNNVLPFDLQAIIYYTTFRNKIENVSFNPFYYVKGAFNTPVLLIQELQQLVSGGTMPLEALLEMTVLVSTIFQYFNDPEFKLNPDNYKKSGQNKDYLKIVNQVMKHDFARVGESYKNAYVTKENQEHYILNTIKQIYKGTNIKSLELD